MQTKKNKKQNSYTTSSFFQKKPTSTRLRDLNLLQRAYHYLKNTNPSGDSKRKQMRGVQLAQQLVDPKINSVQTILLALADKIAQIKAGYHVDVSEVIQSKDNSLQYPREYNKSDSAAAWMHYVNCLLNIPMEDSIIETDVYNYSQNLEEEGSGTIENETNASTTESNTLTTESSVDTTDNQPEEGTSTETPADGSNFFTQFLNRFRRNN